MKLEGLCYKVEAELRFTKVEVDYLIDRAKRHYDHTCQMYGCAIGETGAVVNGVVAQLRLFPTDKNTSKRVFSSRDIDTMLKIIEMPDYNPPAATRKTREELFIHLRAAFRLIQNRYSELTKEEDNVQR